jgi:hypothetical protein
MPDINGALAIETLISKIQQNNDKCITTEFEPNDTRIPAAKLARHSNWRRMTNDLYLHKYLKTSSYMKTFQILDTHQFIIARISPASKSTRHIPQRHSRLRVWLLRTKLRMLVTLSHPLLLFPLLPPSGPPPSDPSHARVEYGHGQDDDDVS